MNAVVNLSIRIRPVLRSSTAEGGGNETPARLPIPGGTGYQPVAVGNLPDDRSFIWGLMELVPPNVTRSYAKLREIT